MAFTGPAACSLAQGCRNLYARKHNVHMVMAEWLLDCAAEGRRVAEIHYKPAGDINLLQVCC